jgi:hypothetical protein
VRIRKHTRFLLKNVEGGTYMPRNTMTTCMAMIAPLFIEGPANAQEEIIDIDATRNNDRSPRVRRFEAGTYAVVPISLAEGGAYTAYMLSTTNPTSWVHDYTVDSAQFPAIRRWDSSMYASAAIAFQHALRAEFTLTRADDVRFYITDQALGDNRGGVSLKVLKLGGFVRGDVNADGVVNISDALKIIFYLFQGHPIDCEDAADLDNNGRVDLSDAIGLLLHLYSMGLPPQPPYPECGHESDNDDLTCDTHAPCAVKNGSR